MRTEIHARDAFFSTARREFQKHFGVRIQCTITLWVHFSAHNTINIMTPIGVVTPAFSTQVSLSPPPFVRKQRTPSSQCGIASHRHKWEHERQSNDLEGCNTKRMRISKLLPTSIFLPLDLDRCDEKLKVISLKSRSLSWEESSIMVPASWADVQ